LLQWKYRRAGQDTLRTSVPQIDEELAESLRMLAELEARLPIIRTQAIKIQLMYDTGRQKARRGFLLQPQIPFFFLLADRFDPCATPLSQ
jgi:hypothetical protein